MMRGTRVRPMVELDLLDSTCTGLLDHSDEDTSRPVVQRGYGRSGRHDYLVRQAFLRSYQFSVRETWKERVMRWIREVNDAVRVVVVEKIERWLNKANELTKGIVVDVRDEINEMAKRILSEVRHEISKGRMRGRVFRFRLTMPAMVCIQCFTPRGD